MCCGNGVVLSGLDLNGETRHVGRLRGGARDRHAQNHRNHRSCGSARPGPPARCRSRSVLLRVATLRVLRELRANQPALRQLRGRRTHRGSREVREGREGPRRPAKAREGPRRPAKNRNHRSGGSARPRPPARCWYRSVLLCFASRETVRGREQGGLLRDAVAEMMAPVRRHLVRCRK